MISCGDVRIGIVKERQRLSTKTTIDVAFQRFFYEYQRFKELIIGLIFK